MMQTLNPYTTTTAKTAEIMARYRPIAPKPEVPGEGESETENSSMTQKIRQSPYLRNIWPHLQARPTRSRKRGRNSLASPPAAKRSRDTTTCLQGLSPPFQVTTSPAKNLSIQAFAHYCPNGLPQLCPFPSLAALNNGPVFKSPIPTPSTLVTLPRLPCPTTFPMAAHEPNVIDLNKVADVPQEKDFLAQLQGPVTTTYVISPLPIRPVRSSISIRSIKEDPGLTHEVQVPKKAKEVEEEADAEALPAIVSDSNNKVRLVNSAYKEMVGQPECSWLDSMVTHEGGSACKRICGEVILHFLDTDPGVPVSSSAFTCWVRIEWGSNGKKSSVKAFCEATRLSCESKDYMFAWRFHAREAIDV